MTNYYSNSADYHNDLDAFEARLRAEQADREEREIVEIEKPQCVCYEYMGDNLDCPIHGLANQEGCDSSMLGQLTAAGFGSGGVL